MIYAAIGFLVPFTIWSVRALRRRYHDTILAAYCAGFNDGMACGGGMTAAQMESAEKARRVMIRSLVSLN